MTTFDEAIKTLTDSQLVRLEQVLLAIAADGGRVDPDAVIAQLRSVPAPALDAEAQCKISARTYELFLDNPAADTAALRAQAVEDFEAGKLAPKPVAAAPPVATEPPVPAAATD